MSEASNGSPELGPGSTPEALAAGVEEPQDLSGDLPALSPLRGLDLLLGGVLFATCLVSSAILVEPRYEDFSTAFGASPRGGSLALGALSLAVGLGSLLPWLLRAPGWLLSSSLFLGMSAATPVLLVSVAEPEDVLACALLGLVLGGLIGALYAARIDWFYLEGGPLLAAPCALAGLLLLPGALHMLSPSLSQWLGLGEVAMGGVLGWGLGSLVGGFLDDYARGLSAALCMLVGGSTLGIGVQALRFGSAS